jgi:hypothetical protein
MDKSWLAGIRRREIILNFTQSISIFRMPAERLTYSISNVYLSWCLPGHF